jgi:predicted permease
MWSKLVNVFRRERVNRELDEELQSHLDEAIEQGRDAGEARRAFGSALHHREASRDAKLIIWIDALRADIVFGWRQLLKNKIASAAAVLSLALAIGSCVSAFRLIDALLLRPLPVASAEHLRILTYQGGDGFEYPLFRHFREAVKGDAELMAISYSNRIALTFGREADIERVNAQFVSGWTFDTLGLKPAIGRLLTANDDVKPKAHPVAVISYDYWQRRFGGDPGAIGRTFGCEGNQKCELVGVIERGFTGTHPGTFTDVYLPAMMMFGDAIENRQWSWFRTWIQLKPDAGEELVHQKLQPAFRRFREQNAQAFPSTMSRDRYERYVNAPLALEPAAAGVSGLQKDYRRSLTILAVLVALVLLIACVNLANLMTAQAAARAREMALRVSIGAGCWRLAQLVLVESALVALLASGLGSLFAWRAAPLVVNAINPPDNPVRLALPADWRVLLFAVALSFVVTLLFGLAPALRASAVRPVSALKGGEDPHARRRLTHVLVAAQVAFCFLVHFVAGLFVTTFDRLSKHPVGFNADRLLAVQVIGKQGRQPIALWNQITDHLRSVRGVEFAALANWALLSGPVMSNFIVTGGGAKEDSDAYFLGIAPGWFDTMRVPLLGGRDFRIDDTAPGVAIVNQAFARRFFDGGDPVGRSFEMPAEGNNRARIRIVGFVGDARYRNMREAVRPTVYVPLNGGGNRDWLTFMVRTSPANPMALAEMLRQEISGARSEFRVSNIHTQDELIAAHTIRERLLAMLAFFFAVVALLLAAVGLFGVLDYSVQQRRREIGIRIALGAKAAHVARRVTVEVFAMVLTGAVAGLCAGVASQRYFASLLYNVKGTDLVMLAVPSAIILAASLLAALPPVIRAVRIDPALMLLAD